MTHLQARRWTEQPNPRLAYYFLLRMVYGYPASEAIAKTRHLFGA